MITIHNLRKNFGTQTAIDIENYTINQGENNFVPFNAGPAES